MKMASKFHLVSIIYSWFNWKFIIIWYFKTMDERVYIRKVVYEKRELNQYKEYKNLKKKKRLSSISLLKLIKGLLCSNVYDVLTFINNLCFREM